MSSAEKKDEALSGRNVAYRLVYEIAEARRQMGQRHPDEKQAAQGIEFGKPLKLGEMHAERRSGERFSIRRGPAQGVALLWNQ